MEGSYGVNTSDVIFMKHTDKGTRYDPNLRIYFTRKDFLFLAGIFGNNLTFGFVEFEIKC